MHALLIIVIRPNEHPNAMQTECRIHVHQIEKHASHRRHIDSAGYGKLLVRLLYYIEWCACVCVKCSLCVLISLLLYTHCASLYTLAALRLFGDYYDFFHNRRKKKRENSRWREREKKRKTKQNYELRDSRDFCRSFSNACGPIIIRHVILREKVTQAIGIVSNVFNRVNSFPPESYNFLIYTRQHDEMQRHTQRERKKMNTEKFVQQINILITFSVSVIKPARMNEWIGRSRKYFDIKYMFGSVCVYVCVWKCK